MRVVLFTGKGGVGKTTSAAATAVLAARRGGRTLVLSTDPAHSLGDALGRDCGPEPARVEDGLWALQVDAQAGFEQHWTQLRRYLTGILRRGGLEGIAAEGLVVPPGLDDLLALFAVHEQAVSGRWDTLVVDCAPTAETLRLLTLPDVLGWYSERFWPARRRITTVARPLLGRELDVLVPDDEVLAAARGLQRGLAAVRDLLADPGTSAVRLVLTPEAVVLAETRRTYTALALHGFVVDGVIVNRVIPDGPDPWRAGWAQAHRVQLEAVRESFAGVPLRTAPYLPAEPVGPDALASLGEQLYGTADPVAAVPVEPPLTLRDDAGDAVLSLALPLTERGGVDLTRIAGELVLTVGGRRRLVALPEALRRSAVSGATLRDGRLEVRFAGTTG